MYPLWRAAGETGNDALRDRLVGDLGPALAAVSGVHGVRIAVADSDVQAAAGRRMQSSDSVPDAVLSMWVDDAGAAPAWGALIDAAVGRRTGYLVAEAEPLVSTGTHPSAPGDRVYGMCQLVFMNRPAGQDREDWLAIWKDSHTRVAIDTQSTFGYRQNVVVRAIVPGTPACDALVEELFPPEAMDSDHAFYATGGDQALLQQRRQEMVESCARFIDFARIDVLPMSEYLLRPLLG